MGSIGDGLSVPAIEQDTGVALLQAEVRGARQAAEQVKLPATGFVASINGESGAVNVQAGTSSPGVPVNVTNGVGTISIGVTGFGTIVTHNQASAVANQATVASAAYVQVEAQATIDKLNALLGAL